MVLILTKFTTNEAREHKRVAHLCRRPWSLVLFAKLCSDNYLLKGTIFLHLSSFYISVINF